MIGDDYILKVNLWFAYDNEMEDVISITDSCKGSKYTCPICNSEVIPKALESKTVSPHFAHVDKNKCDNEAMIHWWYKNKFIERGDTFTIKTDMEYTYICADFTVEKQYSLSTGVYRPDLVIITECGEEIIFEMANTNKKKVQDYIDRWIELDKVIVEVDIKTLQSKDKVFNALYYNGKCFNFNKRDGGYYNTIGKLKERIVQDNTYDIELIKKLDWFWMEVGKYHHENIVTDELIQSIDFLYSELKYDFIKILKRNKCSNVIKSYVDYKMDEFKNKIYSDLSMDEILLDKSEGLLRLKALYKNNKLDVYAVIYNEKYREDDYFDETSDCSKILKKKLFEIKTENLLDNYYEHSIFLLNLIKSDEDMQSMISNFENLNKGMKVEIIPKVLNRRTIHKQETFDYIDVNIKITCLHSTIRKYKFCVKDNKIDGEFKEKLRDILSKDYTSKAGKLCELKEQIDFVNSVMRKEFSKYNVFVTSRHIKDNKYNLEVERRFIKNTYNFDENELLSMENVYLDTFDLIERTSKTKCKDCGDIFALTIKEMDFYKLKDYSLPKRCKPCRQKRKQNK